MSNSKLTPSLQVSVVSNRGSIIFPNQLIIFERDKNIKTCFELLKWIAFQNQLAVLQHIIVFEETLHIKKPVFHNNNSNNNNNNNNKEEHATDAVISSSTPLSSSSLSLPASSSPTFLSKLIRVTAITKTSNFDLELETELLPLIERHKVQQITFVVAHDMIVQASQLLSLPMLQTTHTGFSHMDTGYPNTIFREKFTQLASHPSWYYDALQSRQSVLHSPNARTPSRYDFPYGSMASPSPGDYTRSGIIREDGFHTEEADIKTQLETDDITQSPDSSTTDNDSESFAGWKYHYKRFRPRESRITLLLQVPEFSSLYHVFSGVLIVFLSGVMLDEILEYGVTFRFELLRWNFGKPDKVFLTWICMFAYTFLFVLLVDGYKKKYLDKVGYGAYYILLLIPFLMFPLSMISHFQMPIACACIVASEQVRMIMKIHAYVYEMFRACNFGEMLHVSPISQPSKMSYLRQDWAESWEHAVRFGATNNRHLKKSDDLSDNEDDRTNSFNEEQRHRSLQTKESIDNENDESELQNNHFRSPKSLHNLYFDSSRPIQDGVHSDLHANVEEEGKDETINLSRKNEKAKLLEGLPKKAHIPAYYLAAEAPLSAQLSSFFSFMFCPSLIYRTHYPRNRQRINWHKVFGHLYNFLACLLFVFVVFFRFCAPQYQLAASQPGGIGEFISAIFASTLPGMSALLFGFFGILHCWINMWAEVTGFADRRFYDDWWNSKSWAAYYRKWNVVVYDWLHDYVFLPLLEAGFSRQISEFLIFLISSLVYEYLISVCLGFVYPVFLVTVAMCGFVYIPLTQHQKQSSIWNVFLWAILFLQNGTFIVLYSREWYAKKAYDNGTVEIDKHAWLPYSWQVLSGHETVQK